MASPSTLDRPRHRVLLIEDDLTLAFLVREALENKGYEVATAADPAAGLEDHNRSRADLIILDRMFPGADGLATVKALRAAGEDVPVLMLTSRGEVEDKVAGLGAGADDYLCKPFSIVELQARVQAILRRAIRQATAQPEATLHGPFVLHWPQLRVEREGRALDLTPQEFRILALLVRCAGRPLSRQELLDHAWPSTSRPASLRTVDVYVARLRSKLGRAEDPPWIRTEGGGGYSWTG